MSLALLKKVKLFSGLNEKILKSIFGLTSIQKFNKNNVILRETDKVGDTFYMINKGKVKITRSTDDGKEVVISVLGAGDFFGEMSILDGLSRSANVVSIDATEVLTLKGRDFLNILHKYPQINFNLTKVLCSRIRKSDAQIKRLSIMNTVGKVASTLVGLVESKKKKGKNSAEIFNPPSLKDIANMSGVSKSSVSRVLNNFIKSGYVKREGNKLIIKKYLEFQRLYC